MTFIEWLREEYGYTGDNDTLVFDYSASELDTLYEKYLLSGEKDDS